jgi:hypothetical protein
MTAPLLDCGHAPTPSPHTSGSARSMSGRTMCYSCADSEQAAIVADKSVTAFDAYLSVSGDNITTWTGGVLARVTSHTMARTGWYGSKISYIRAVDCDGARWYGKNGGTGMFITMRRAAVAK